MGPHGSGCVNVLYHESLRLCDLMVEVVRLEKWVRDGELSEPRTFGVVMDSRADLQRAGLLRDHNGVAVSEVPSWYFSVVKIGRYFGWAPERLCAEIEHARTIGGLSKAFTAAIAAALLLASAEAL